MDKKGVMVDGWRARRKEWNKKRWEKKEKGKSGFWKRPFFVLIQSNCGLLSVNQLAACHPHSLKRERWGLLHYGLMPGRVE